MEGQSFKFQLSVLLLFSLFILSGCRKDASSTEPEILTPTAPRLFYPPNDTIINSTSVTLSWVASAGAESYTLQISKNNSFSPLAYNQSDIVSVIKEVTGLTDSTQYFWRVRASNIHGVSLWSSPARSFTINGTELSGTPCPGISTITYAGKTYHTVLIGSQCWLRENLDVGSMLYIGQIPNNNGTIEKFCYNDKLQNCNTYGGLYTWDEAMNYSINEKVQGICPEGWHIPTRAEFTTLAASVENNGNALKEIGEGTGPDAGTNTSGFSALLAGYSANEGNFYYLDIKGYFWSSTQHNAISAYYTDLYYNGSLIYFSNSNKEYGFSIRCIKDNNFLDTEIIRIK